MSPNPVSVTVRSLKVSYNGEMRRFPFPIDASEDQFAVISRTVARSFGLQRPSFVLQYIDDENDTITVGSQLELSAALELSRSPILRFQVAVRSGADAPTVPEPVVAESPSPSPSPAASPSPATGPWCGGRAGGWWRHGFGAASHHQPTPGASHGHGFGHGFGFGGGFGARGGRGGCRRSWGQQLQEQYREQLAELEREGLNCGFWAVRVLSNLNGDVEAAKAFIRSRKQAMSALRIKYASQLEELERLGLLTPGASLSPERRAESATPDQAQHHHNHCLRKCLRLLERFDGDTKQVVAHFESKRAEREALPTRYASQLAELKAQGFWCEPVCLRLLNKFDGDVAKVAECMNKFRNRHGNAAGATATASPATPDYEEQLAALAAKGYARPKCARLLRKLDGNVEHVERVLNARKQWFADTEHGGMCEKRRAFKAAKEQYANEIQQLKDMGLRCKWLMVPLLQKHNGDVAAVALELSQ